MSKKTAEERISQLKNQIKIIQSEEKKKERKERTKRLIEIGAVVESVFGESIGKDMLPELRSVLMGEDGQGTRFRKSLAAKIAAKKENISSPPAV